MELATRRRPGPRRDRYDRTVTAQRCLSVTRHDVGNLDRSASQCRGATTVRTAPAGGRPISPRRSSRRRRSSSPSTGPLTSPDGLSSDAVILDANTLVSGRPCWRRFGQRTRIRRRTSRIVGRQLWSRRARPTRRVEGVPRGASSAEAAMASRMGVAHSTSSAMVLRSSR